MKLFLSDPYELFTAEIAEDLSVADIRQITFNNRDDLHPTWFNPPYVFPSEHDFGDVIAGEKSNPKTFTIYSNGVTLNIETVRVTGDNAGEFRILGDACTGKKLEPGENCNVVAIFAPDSEGSKTATMVVSLDGSDSIPIASQLRGEGVRDTDSDGVSDKIEEKGCTSPNDADTDDDGISDGVEDANQNGLFDDGETDPCNVDTDGDGIHDGVEDGNHNGFVDFWETDPADWNSVPAFIVHLSKGFNLIGIHAAGELRYWLPALGDDGQIEKVMAYDDETGLFVTLIPGDASSENYTLDGAEGLIVYAKQDKAIGFNSLRCFPMDLKPGSNLVGFGCPPDGYTAFQLLKDLGGETVSSIQRYSPNEGAFQTAGFADDEALTGIDFPTLPGEGYFVFSIVDTPPTCYFDKQCAVDSFCEKSIGDCSGVGRCVGIPDVFCPDNYDPVCGCDGRTHSNGCYALVVGVSIDYVGECN